MGHEMLTKGVITGPVSVSLKGVLKCAFSDITTAICSKEQ